jgi:hypothetical protein
MNAQKIEALKAAVKALKGKYRFHKTEAEKQVSRWQWATGPYFSLEPFFHERHRSSRGRLMDKQPKSFKDIEAFGFDGQNRLVLIRQFWDASGSKVGNETFITHDGDMVTKRSYMYAGKEVGSVTELRFENGLLQELCGMGSGGHHHRDIYRHDGARLMCIEIDHQEAWAKGRLEFVYNNDGSGQAFYVNSDGERSASFKFAAPGVIETVSAEDLRSLCKKFEQALTQDIHAVVQKASYDGKVYSVVIVYGGDPAQGCIPTLGVGVARDGETVPLVKPFNADAEAFWNPAEFSKTFGTSALYLLSPELEDLDRRLVAACINGGKLDLRALCNNVAVQLNAMPWPALPKWQHFIVYAVDDDLADLHKNLKFVVAARNA